MFLDYVAREDLPALYNLATVFAYPSFYEGFGLPVLEAMACGAPVVTSNLSSMPEVLGDCGLYADPHSPESIAGAISKLLSDEKLRNLLGKKAVERAAGFSWKKTAKETLAAYGELLKG
jgi:glycosyltransferase involved in cell wall biosynthesis